MTFANLGSVRLPSLKFVGHGIVSAVHTRRAVKSAGERTRLQEDTANLVCQLSIFNSFSVIRTASAKSAVFTYRSPHVCFPWDAPEAITLNVVWMER